MTVEDGLRPFQYLYVDGKTKDTFNFIQGFGSVKLYKKGFRVLPFDNMYFVSLTSDRNTIIIYQTRC